MGDNKIASSDKTPTTIELPNSISGLKGDRLLIKPLDFNELMISLDRLTRFKYPYSKRNRVYKEILTRYTVSPKISLKNYYDFPLGVINALVQLIWNTSVSLLNQKLKFDTGINMYLSYEESREFSAGALIRDIISSENVLRYSKPGILMALPILTEVYNKDIESQIIEALNESGFSIPLLSENLNQLDILTRLYLLYELAFPLDLSGLLEFAEKQKEYGTELAKNTERLIWINNQIKKEDINLDNPNIAENLELIYVKADQYREDHGAKFPAKLLILVEGSTEEKLLPIFSKLSGIDFDKEGVQLIAAGGKNQVERIYNKYYQKINLPIFVILDSDAAVIASEIKSILRENDHLFIIPEGEFEDILSVEHMCRSINNFYRMTAKVVPEEIQTECQSGQPMTAILDSLWKTKGFGEFSKAEFAQIIAENVKDKNDITPILGQIIGIINKMLHY